MTKPCAFRPCDDPTCHLCALARIPIRKPEGLAADGIRDDAKAVPEKKKEKPIWMPKKRHRVGPHR